MNHLQYESSPYLRQHATNPVEWFAWNERTLAKAKEEDLPILVSIGYSTCHWCHVMERESFMDAGVAAYMNQHFVNIKIDREERPDLDSLYLDACQLIAGTSGWPLNIFLTPDLKPFFGGTYFPPEEGHKRLSWFQALQYAVYNFNNNRRAVERQANKIIDRLKNIKEEKESPTSKKNDLTQNIFDELKRKFDPEAGGFGQEQKFPNIMALEFLLQYHYLKQDQSALVHVIRSLNALLQGGIYDQLGGGISRYTIDRNWQIPHFEKMLYDNALLIQVLASTYQFTGRRKYKTAFTEITAFLESELKNKEGGFFAAIDSESERGEGEYYTWSKNEIEKILKEEADLFIEFFGVTEKGNFEGKNILHQAFDLFQFAEQKGYGRDELRKKLNDSRQKLLTARNLRKKPNCDSKIIGAWNSLMVSAYSRMYQATGEVKYYQAAKKLLDFILEKFLQEDEISLYRIYADKKVYQSGLLKDYAFLIRALLDVFQISFEKSLLDQAEKLTDYVRSNFRGKEEVLFSIAEAGKQDLVVNQRDVRDEDMPSGNAMMSRNLQDLAILSDRPSYRMEAEKMLSSMQNQTEKSPLVFASWGTAYLADVFGVMEIAIVGHKAKDWAVEIGKSYLPFKVLLAAEQDEGVYTLLKGKTTKDGSLIYVCQDYSCQKPMDNPEAFKQAYDKGFKSQISQFNK